MEHGMLIPEEFFSEVEQTFEHEDLLPPLPVPPLRDAMDVYLHSVKALSTEEEYERTRAIVAQFVEQDGGAVYRELLQRGREKRNWLEKMWEDKAYLENRTPLGPFSNFGGPGTEGPLGEGKQVERLSLIIWYMLQYFMLIRRETLKVLRLGTQPCSMHQVRSMFCTYRRPGEKKDTIHRYFRTAREGSCSRQIVILCKGYVYKMDVVYDDGSLLTVPEIQTQLDYILHQCNTRPYGPSVGALTSEERTKWYHMREHLISLHQQNQQHLDTIERSIFCAALDDHQPVTLSQKSHVILCGDARNRWYDKSMSVVGCKNGETTCNMEHSPYDGIVALRMLQFMEAGVTHARYEWRGTKEIRNLKKPIELEFHLDTRIERAVADAVVQHKQNSDRLVTYAPVFTEFGKNYCKRVKIHPDSFIQIAVQLGYYRLHRKFVATYETALAALFWRGRTETARTCTPEVVDFCKAMGDSTCTDSEKVKLLYRAYEKHTELMTKCLQFRACDRLFVGLYCIAEEKGLPLPEVFTDPAFVKSGGGGNFPLSTSCIGWHPMHGGCAPMTAVGYGFYYTIQDDGFRPFLACYKDDPNTDCVALYEAVCQSMRDMKHLLDTNHHTTHKL